MAILQGILDAQARLDTAVAAVSTKVDTLIANQTDPTAMSVAEQQQVADQITASAVAVDAVVAK